MHHFFVLQVIMTESWMGPENEATASSTECMIELSLHELQIDSLVCLDPDFPKQSLNTQLVDR